MQYFWLIMGGWLVGGAAFALGAWWATRHQEVRLDRAFHQGYEQGKGGI